MRIAIYFELPGASYAEAVKHVGKMVEPMVNPTDADIEIRPCFAIGLNVVPVNPLFPTRIVLECEDTKLRRDKECQKRCENHGWVMRDGQVFNTLRFTNLHAALTDPDGTVYDSWAECCKGEGITDDLTADLGITEPVEKEVSFSPAGFLTGSAIDKAKASATRGHTAAEAESIKTETGIVTRSENIHAGGPVGGEAPRLVPRMATERAEPDGYVILHDDKGWFWNSPDGPDDTERYPTKSLAIDAAHLDDIRGIEEEAPAEPRDPETVFKASIDDALDHLLGDIPGWREKFHPLASSKGKRALEDLVGLVASIRAELKTETSKNVTN